MSKYLNRNILLKTLCISFALVGFSFFIAKPAQAAVPSFIQSTSTASDFIGTSTLQFSNNLTAGNTIIIVEFHGANIQYPPNTPTDSQGNIYSTLLASSTHFNGDGILIWTAAIKQSASDIITLSSQYNSEEHGVVAMEVSGINNETLDAVSPPSGCTSTGNCSTANLTTGSNNDFVLGLFSSPTILSYSSVKPFSSAGSDEYMGVEYYTSPLRRSMSATASVVATVNYPVDNLAVAFKPYVPPAGCGSGYNWCRTITVSSTLVAPSGTALSSFPIEVSSALYDVASAAHGGMVQNLTTQSGSSYTGQVPADLIFSTSADCSTHTNWEFESYSSSTGAFTAWVNNGTLSQTAGETFYVCYDKPSITTFQASPASVWSGNFKGVYHLPNGTMLDTNDSTSGGNNGTNNSALASSGEIDGDVLLNGTSSYLSLAQNSGLPIYSTSGYSVEFWVNGATGQNSNRIFAESNSTDADPIFSIDTLNGVGSGITLFIRDNSGVSQLQVDSTKSILDSTWHDVVWTDNNGAAALYVDGIKDASNFSYTPSTYSFNEDAVGALVRSSVSNYFAGSVDELRLSNVVRSPDWIYTEYQNEKNPSGFLTFGTPAEAPASSGSGSSSGISFVQVGSNSATATSTSVTMNTTAGDLLVGICVVNETRGATPNISDSNGHPWDSPEGDISPGDAMVELSYSSNIVGGSTTSNCSIATSTAYSIYFSVAEYSGVSTVDPLDAYAHNGGYLDLVTVGPNVKTTQPGDLVVGVQANELNSGSKSTASPYTQRSSSQVYALSDRIASSAGTVSGASTTVAYGDGWIGYTYAFAPHPAISLDSKSTVHMTCGPTCTWSYTVGNQANRLLVLSLPLGGWDGALSGTFPVCGNIHCATSATYDGEALTKAVMAQGSSYQDDELWYLVGPPSGTHDIVLTLETSTDANADDLTASSWFGVDQSKPIDATSSNATSDGTATVSITPKHNGDMFMDVAQWQNPNYVMTPGSSQQVISQASQYNGQYGTSYIPPVSTISSQTFSWAGNPAGQNTLDVAISLKPAWPASVARVRYCDTSGTNLSCSLSNVAAGDAIAVNAEWTSTSTLSCGDGTNTYHLAVSNTGSGYGVSAGWWVALNVASGSPTITCTGSSGWMVAAEYSGVATTSAIDAYASSNSIGSGSILEWPSVTVPKSGELVLVGGGSEANAPWNSFNSPVSTIASQTYAYATGDYTDASAGSFAATATVTNTNAQYWSGVVLVLKAASNSAPVTMAARVIVNATKLLLDGAHLIIR